MLRKVRNLTGRFQRSRVDALIAAWKRGEYVASHQGIAIDAQGYVIDGEHRLTALAEMPDGFYIDIWVARDVPAEAQKVMDIGFKRSQAVVLNEDRRVVEAARFLAVLFAGRANMVTPQYLIPFVDRIREAHADLTDFCPSACKMWSSAPVRAAAVITDMSGGDMDHVKLVYRAMITKDFNTMPPIAQAVFRAHINGTVRAHRGTDTFVRALRIFNPKNARHSKVQIRDASPALDSVRAMLRIEVLSDIPTGEFARQKGAGKRTRPPHYALAGV